MVRFGKARLYRNDVSVAHKTQFILSGVADPSHFLRSRYFLRHIKHLNPNHILDAGCGRGDYSFFMAEHWQRASVEAVDLDAKLILKNQEVQKRWGLNNVKFSSSDILSYKPQQGYDLIVCIDALEHIEDQEGVLQHLYSLLNDNGYLYLHIPLVRLRDEPLRKYLKAFHEWSDREHHAKARSQSEVMEMLQKARFVCQNSQYTFSYHFGELACSLFAVFFRNTPMNQVMQSVLFPFTRLLCYAELMSVRSNGYAMAVTAQKVKAEDK